MDSIRSQLMSMGFNEASVKRAIESCPEAQTLEQVMEWLIAHEDELNNSDSRPVASSVGQASGNKSSDSSKVEAGESVAAAAASKAAQATDGTQAGGPNETAANMAARKKITVEEAQRLITERQARRVEEERKKEIEDEKRRRVDGQKMAETRQELQDQERIRLAQQIRREKIEKELHRKSVLEQIARDREAMRNRNKPPEQQQSTTSNSSPTKDVKVAPVKAPASECKLALRFPDGANKIQKFSPQEQLSAVRLFVQMERPTTGCIEFIAPPNKKLTEAQMNDTLESLGLCPASRLEIKISESVWTNLD